MHKLLSAGFVLIVTLFFACTESPVGGTEVENERFTARIVNRDGTAAANATVMILPATYLPNVTETAKKQITRLQITTDADGYFSLSDLEEGCYNIYAEKGELAAYRDSVYVREDGITESDITLNATISLCGNINVEPNHNPRLVEVQLYGTTFYTNVDSTGMFCFPQIAPGEYHLRAIAHRDGYVPKDTTIQTSVSAGDTTEITLKMYYTDLPVVTGLEAAYDRETKQITLSWNATSFPNFYEYVIYRDYDGAIMPSTEPVAVTVSNRYVDSTAWEESNENRAFRYRVAIRDNGMVIGPTYGFVLVSVPVYYLTGSISTPDSTPSKTQESLRVFLECSSSPAPLSMIEWFVNDAPGGSTSFERTDSIMSFTDSVNLSLPDSASTISVICRISNFDNLQFSDSLSSWVYDFYDTLDNDSSPDDTIDDISLPGDTLDNDSSPDDSIGDTSLPDDTLNDTIFYEFTLNDTLFSGFIIDGDSIILSATPTGNTVDTVDFEFTRGDTLFNGYIIEGDTTFRWSRWIGGTTPAIDTVEQSYRTESADRSVSAVARRPAPSEAIEKTIAVLFRWKDENLPG